MNINQFCYWLQGYFEIACNPYLDVEKLLIIKDQLSRIKGEKNEFIAWLERVCDYIEKTSNVSVTLDEFFPVIKSSLSSVFYHAIDDSYEGVSRQERHQVHEEGLNDKS